MRRLVFCGLASIMLLHAAPSTACMPGNFSFALGSARLNPQERWVIDDILSAFRGRRGIGIRLTATTDGLGSANANMRLARRRGEAVKDALIRHGIPARTIDVVVEEGGSKGGADPNARQVSWELIDAPARGNSRDSSRC